MKKEIPRSHLQICGHEIVDQFISLVNPEIPIQPFVVKLTGNQ
jgi:DNA polymerase III epsilon subunit-like protein